MPNLNELGEYICLNINGTSIKKISNLKKQLKKGL